MKLVDKELNKWKKIDKIILLVNSIDISYKSSVSLNLNCNFENISRGRCNITIQRIEKKIPDTLYIHTDQPLMVVNIFYKIEKIEKLINFLGMNKNNKKKIRLELDISDNLMVNKDGYLYVKDKFELNINSISWNIPII
tara:strand:+ start:405 stop:821 length:417 start_codon:yes stop_codon:yes gene_type:complete